MKNRYWNRTGAAQAHYDEMEAAGFAYTQATYGSVFQITVKHER